VTFHLNFILFSDFSVEEREYIESLRSREAKYQPGTDYMERQPFISSAMRCINVHWLAQLQKDLRLCPSTLFIAVNILDRYLSSWVVTRYSLQLFAATSLWIAAKFQEQKHFKLFDHLFRSCKPNYPNVSKKDFLVGRSFCCFLF